MVSPCGQVFPKMLPYTLALIIPVTPTWALHRETCFLAPPPKPGSTLLTMWVPLGIFWVSVTHWAVTFLEAGARSTGGQKWWVLGKYLFPWGQ